MDAPKLIAVFVFILLAFIICIWISMPRDIATEPYELFPAGCKYDNISEDEIIYFKGSRYSVNCINFSADDILEHANNKLLEMGYELIESKRSYLLVHASYAKGESIFGGQCSLVGIVQSKSNKTTVVLANYRIC